jgi:hypothetical protein
MYNVHELGPENIYANGAVTRGRGPATIDGQTGYVEPNIEGRVAGGFTRGPTVMEGGYGWGGPQRIPGGTGAPGTTYGVNYGQGSNVQGTPNGSYNANAINPATGYPNENPGGQPGGYNFMTEPGYQFRFEEGQRALDRGAAARGGLLSGGYGRKAIRYGQGFASNEYANVYNRIANIAGLGQTAGGQAGQTALYGAGMMGNAAGNAGFARASGYAAQGDIWGNAISSAGSFAQDMWGDKLSGWWKNRGSGDGEIGGGSGGVPFRGRA